VGQSFFLKVVLFLLLYLCLVIYKAPARLIATPIETFLPDLSINKLDGTLWQGCGRDTNININNVLLNVGDLCWSFQPTSLLGFRPRILLSTQAATHSLYADVSVTFGGSVEVSSLTTSFPIALLEPWVPLLVSGNVAATIDEVVIESLVIKSIDGKIQIADVFWLMGDRKMRLGDYSADIGMPQLGRVSITARDEAAYLGLSGELQLALTGSYQSELALTPKPGLAEEISNSLPFLGKLDAGGDIIISEQGSWR